MATWWGEIRQFHHKYTVLAVAHDVIDGFVLCLVLRLIIIAFFTTGTRRDVDDDIFCGCINVRMSTAITLAVPAFSKPALAHPRADCIVVRAVIAWTRGFTVGLCITTAAFIANGGRPKPVACCLCTAASWTQ